MSDVVDREIFFKKNYFCFVILPDARTEVVSLEKRLL